MYVRAWSEAQSNQPYAQDAGMSLSEPTYAPHVLVCVRVRGAFKKTKTKSPQVDRSYFWVFGESTSRILQ